MNENISMESGSSIASSGAIFGDKPVASEASSESLRQVWWQRTIDWIFFPIFCGGIALAFKWIGRYKVTNRDALRAQFKELMKDPVPTIICANHLTFIDSALVMWALASNWHYFFNFKHFSWNLPAGDFFGKKWYFRIVAYFTKCVFIHRDGSKQHKDEVLDICHHLLQKGEIVSIFPEGRRSRKGVFETDHLTYGVARLIERIGKVRVICVYVRGHKQEGFTKFPARGSKFNMRTDVIFPTSTLTGRERRHDLLMQVADSLVHLEQEHFRNHQ